MKKNGTDIEIWDETYNNSYNSMRHGLAHVYSDDCTFNMYKLHGVLHNIEIYKLKNGALLKNRTNDWSKECVVYGNESHDEYSRLRPIITEKRRQSNYTFEGWCEFEEKCKQYYEQYDIIKDKIPLLIDEYRQKYIIDMPQYLTYHIKDYCMFNICEEIKFLSFDITQLLMWLCYGRDSVIFYDGNYYIKRNIVIKWHNILSKPVDETAITPMVETKDEDEDEDEKQKLIKLLQIIDTFKPSDKIKIAFVSNIRRSIDQMLELC